MKKRITVIVLIMISILACVATANGFHDQYAQVTTKKGPLNMRKTASKKASVIEKIPKDTIIPITPVDDIWCKCTYNEKEGYVMTEYLTLKDISQFRTLSMDDTGEDVQKLKEQLRELYFFNADTEINDRYDSDMETAVRLFQEKQGVEETGIISPELQAFMTWGNPKNNLPTKKMTVTIKSSCSGYNHVGNSWSKYYSINSGSVSSGDVIDIILNESISVYTKITEKDTVPDVGSAKENVDITQEYYDDGFTVTHKVAVKENRGRYSGNKAYWTVTYTFVPY
jgi:peptidoglycan hydrolase-like protein with peptidoglycan-binding domain